MLQICTFMGIEFKAKYEINVFLRSTGSELIFCFFFNEAVSKLHQLLLLARLLGLFDLDQFRVYGFKINKFKFYRFKV